MSLERALLGEVTENLIVLSAGIKGSKILIRANFDEDATESELNSISCVGTEVIADFSKGTVAVVHTHPPRASVRPSTSGGNTGKGDHTELPIR